MPCCSPGECVTCCCTKNNLTVTFPAQQLIPDGTVKQNPFFHMTDQVSYWTYKLSKDCAPGTPGISNWTINVCPRLKQTDFVVEAKQDTCGNFEELPLNPPKGNIGFEYQNGNLKIEYPVENGEIVTFRITITNPDLFNLVADPSTITVKAGPSTIIFTEEEGCPCNFTGPSPECRERVSDLKVIKTCPTGLNQNGELEYSVKLENTGAVAATGVILVDTLNYPSSTNIGSVSTSPPAVDIQTGPPLVITWDLGNIPAGASTTVSFRVPVTFARGGTFEFVNQAEATADGEGMAASDSCRTVIAVVKLQPNKQCSVQKDTAAYSIMVQSQDDSPATTVTIEDLLTIPENTTVQFIGFGPGSATVPTGEPIQGPQDVMVTWAGVSIPPAGMSPVLPIVYQVLEFDCSLDPSTVLVTSNRVTNVFITAPGQVQIGATTTRQVNINAVCMLQCGNEQ